MVNEARTRPQLVFEENGRRPHLPELHNVVRALDQVVSVDYYIPGCPPTPKITKAAVAALLDGSLPPKGSVLAPDIALCDECPRRDSKPTNVAFTEFKRTAPEAARPAALFSGARRRVHGAGHAAGLRRAVPWRQHALHGLLRPHRPRADQGAKILSSLCANIAVKEEDEIDLVLAGIPDPVGTFYRYGLARSLLRRRVDLQGGRAGSPAVSPSNRPNPAEVTSTK